MLSDTINLLLLKHCIYEHHVTSFVNLCALLEFNITENKHYCYCEEIPIQRQLPNFIILSYYPVSRLHGKSVFLYHR